MTKELFEILFGFAVVKCNQSFCSEIAPLCDSVQASIFRVGY